MNLQDLIDSLPAQAANLDRPLLDPRLPRGASPALLLALGHEWRGRFAGGEWRARAAVAGAAALSVFANEADLDAEHIFGSVGRKPGAAKSPALLQPGAGRAWLKLAVNGEVEGHSKGGIGVAQVRLSGHGQVGLGAYLRADPQDTLRDALARRREAAVFVLDADSVRRIGVDDACYIALGGKLSARLELNWADVLSAPLASLEALASDAGPLALAVDARASVAMQLQLSDSFRLVFVGRDAERVGVSLQRSASDAFALDAKAGASVRLANPDIARELLADLAAQILGTTPTQLARVRSDLSQLLGALDDATGLLRLALAKAGVHLDAAVDAAGLPLARRRLAQLQALAALADFADRGAAAAALGLTLTQLADVAARIDALGAELATRLGNRLDALLTRLQLPSLPKQPTTALRGLLARLDRLEAALSDAASRRVEAGLEFEYRRIGSDESLFAAVLERGHADFEALHRALLDLDLASVLDATRQGHSGIALESFLHQKTIKRSISLGLDLGGFFSDRDSAAREWSESLRVLPDADARGGQRRERRLALKGNRTRVETAFGSRSLWRGDFAADFATTDAGGNNGRWRFSLALGFRSATPSASEAWLLGAADYAALWGVVAEAQVEQLGQRLRDTGASGKLAAIELSLTLRPAAFEHEGFLRAFGTVTDESMRAALATALQRIEGFTERCDIRQRRVAYQAAIGVLLGNSGVDLRDVDAIARYVARELAASAALRAFEAQHDPPSPGSVADLSRRSGSMLGLFREFRQASALERFRSAASPGGGADRKSIEKALAGWDLAWRDRYPLRWQVALLRSLADNCGVPGSALDARLKLTVEGRTAYLFGNARSQ